jgi:PAS domain S-box-containing protein
MPIRAIKSREQQAAESDVESFRRDLGPFVVTAETTRMPMLFADAREPDHPLIFANDSFLALTGYAREEVLGQRFDFLMERPDDAQSRAQVEAAFAGHGESSVEMRCRLAQGSVRWAAVVISPIRDKADTIVQHFISFVDLTTHMREEDRLRFLLHELNHRTQNTLATVQAIAMQTLRGCADPRVVDALEGRILALAKVHGLLGRAHWEAPSLFDVIEQVLRPFGLDGAEAGRFCVARDDVRLQPKAALTLAMVFHELASNAQQHGALADRSGKVDIAWQVEPGPQGDTLRLRWQESGGPPVTAPPPGREGFGSRLIAGLAHELDGEVRLDYAGAGVACAIVMPLGHRLPG